MRTRPIIGLIAIAAAAGVLTGSLALAHDVEFDTHATKPVRSQTANPAVHRYSGKVTSPKRACRRKRTVILQIEGSPVSKSTRTRRNGHWSLQLPTPAADYELTFTVLFKDLDPSHEHKHVCKAVVRTYPYPGTDPESPPVERG